MPTPYVSVLIDTFNHERFIEQAIQSVLAQNFPASDREIVVVDDGSTDRTPEILRKFEPHIRVLRKQNGGQASAFNAGIPECSGQIVTFLDGDDWWAPDKLKHVVATMAGERSLGLVGHGIITVFEDGTQRVENLREGFTFQANEMPGALLFRCRCTFLGTSRMTIRRTLLQQIGKIPEQIHVQADEYLYTLAAVRMLARVLPEALTFYRLHTDNGFIISTGDPQKLRRKQKSLQALVQTLPLRLAEFGMNSQVRDALLAYTRACAEQLRLSLEGGWPWETFRTEKTLYQVEHPDASLSYRLLKSLLLSASLLVPPASYYKVRQSLAQNRLYRRLRQRWLPFPVMPHIRSQERKLP